MPGHLPAHTFIVSIQGMTVDSLIRLGDCPSLGTVVHALAPNPTSKRPFQDENELAQCWLSGDHKY